MTETYDEDDRVRWQHQQHRWSESKAKQVAKAATAAIVGGCLVVLSGLTLAATVITLTVATPVLVIFSPVLVPAMITVFLLATGLFTSVGFGVAAVAVLAWMYRYVTSEETREEQRLGWNWKGGEREEHAAGQGHHATGGVQLTTGARAGLYAQS